jgi:DNA-binding MarR family transcriptional regulator
LIVTLNLGAATVRRPNAVKDAGRKNDWKANIELVHLLNRGSQIAEECLSRELKRLDLASITSRQLLVLQALEHYDTCTQVALTRHTGIDRSTLADLVRRMSGRGWVIRRRSKADAREQLVRISPLGRTIVERARGALADAERAVMQALSAQHGPVLKGALRALWDDEASDRA